MRRLEKIGIVFMIFGVIAFTYPLWSMLFR